MKLPLILLLSCLALPAVPGGVTAGKDFFSPASESPSPTASPRAPTITFRVSTKPHSSDEERLVAFWNLENFFDWRDDSLSVSPSDYEFSSRGPRRWTRKRFSAKAGLIAKSLLYLGTSEGRLPDAVGFAEVENRFVLKQLTEETALRKLDYRIVHFDSPDPRGIDCALLYRASVFDLLGAEPLRVGSNPPGSDSFRVGSDHPGSDTLAPIPYDTNSLYPGPVSPGSVPFYDGPDHPDSVPFYDGPVSPGSVPFYDGPDHPDSETLAPIPYDTYSLYPGPASPGSVPLYDGPDFLTRDILHVCLRDRATGRLCDFLVCHFPSKYGGASVSGPKRRAAARRLQSAADSLLQVRPGTALVAMGDFNDTPDAPELEEIRSLRNLAAPLHARGEGTIRYDGRWDLIDMFFVSDAPDNPPLSDNHKYQTHQAPSKNDTPPTLQTPCDIHNPPSAKMTIARLPFLLVRDRTHGGEKPLRTYSGPRYLGGVSDHCPVLLSFSLTYPSPTTP